jgi:hypothetical protein
MASRLLQDKIDIETFIANNYDETTIHWSGQEFDSSSVAEWIFVDYRCTSTGDCGLDNTSYSSSGYLSVTVMSENRHRTHQIADVVVTMMKGIKIGDIVIGDISIDAQGIIDDINKSYMDLNFSVMV